MLYSRFAIVNSYTPRRKNVGQPDLYLIRAINTNDWFLSKKLKDFKYLINPCKNNKTNKTSWHIHSESDFK